MFTELLIKPASSTTGYNPLMVKRIKRRTRRAQRFSSAY